MNTIVVLSKRQKVYISHDFGLTFKSFKTLFPEYSSFKFAFI